MAQKTGSGDYRRWCFTLPADEDKGEHISWAVSSRDNPPLHWGSSAHFRYCKYQVERAPTTGKIHLQGYLCLSRSLRLAQVKNAYSGRAHWERAYGTIEDNDRYVSKEETRVCGPFELGTRPEGGASKTRARWATVNEMIKDGSDRNTILQEMPELAPQVRGIDALIEANRKQPLISREVMTYYVYGPTGTGKTHHALHQFPTAYLVRGKYMEGKSFDQYQDEDTLILDEWSPLEWPLTLMNSLMDKWKCPLACRYFNKYAHWTRVIITTNFKPEECYVTVFAGQKESFKRRLTYIMNLDSRVETLEFPLRAPSSPILVDDEDIADSEPKCTCGGLIVFAEGCSRCLSCGDSKCQL